MAFTKKYGKSMAFTKKGGQKYGIYQKSMIRRAFTLKGGRPPKRRADGISV